MSRSGPKRGVSPAFAATAAITSTTSTAISHGPISRRGCGGGDATGAARAPQGQSAAEAMRVSPQRGQRSSRRGGSGGVEISGDSRVGACI